MAIESEKILETIYDQIEMQMIQNNIPQTDENVSKFLRRMMGTILRKLDKEDPEMHPYLWFEQREIVYVLNREIHRLQNL